MRQATGRSQKLPPVLGFAVKRSCRSSPFANALRVHVAHALFATSVLGGCKDHHDGVASATVPLIVEGNRPFIELVLRVGERTPRTARFLVDSGGGGFLMTESLAGDLGLELGETSTEEGRQYAHVKTSIEASVGAFVLELRPERVSVAMGTDDILPDAAPGHADGMLPGHVLSQYHVVFDYPHSTFTIAHAGVLRPKGESIAMPVSKGSGFPRTEIEIDGITYGFLIDTGASFTMVSEVVLKALGSAHADWPRHDGAYGEAATLGGQTLETLTVPRGRWGSLQLAEFGVTSQREGTFEQWMSSMMTTPISGSLAGNVLRRYRVELDYPGRTLYLGP